MTTRRDFIAGGSAALVAAGFPSVRSRADYDLIVRGGTVFDGSGREGLVSDLAITADRIVALAPKIDARAREEIDARGLAVSPGFIDIHSHGDGNMESDPRVPRFLQRDSKTGEITSVDVEAIRTNARFGKILERSIAGWEGKDAPPDDRSDRDEKVD